MTDDLGADAYLTLFGLATGDGIAVVNGQAVVNVTDGRGNLVSRAAIDQSVFDRLEDRGLIDHVGDTVAITGAGRLRVKRWAKVAFKGAEKRTVLGVVG